MFESFANSERYKTCNHSPSNNDKFESFANSERYKTDLNFDSNIFGLRALLIQKDTKPS